jgi:2-oxoglutarate dehydrogenase E2 component (dihydrolipoamide succinyltransferase)
MKDIVVPTVGESITEGVLTAWLVADGQEVPADAPIFELETDKVTLQVPCPTAGRVRQTVPAGSTVRIGQVVGALEPVEGSAVQRPETPVHFGPGNPGAQAMAPGPGDLAALAPSVRRLVAEHGLDPAAIPGSGPRGRITKGDVLAALAAPSPAPSPGPEPSPGAEPSPGTGTGTGTGGRQTRTRMTPLRQRIAERLVAAQHQAAMLTTFNEVDMSAVLGMREAHGAAFENQHGVRLGFMSFFVKAVAALRAVPSLNAFIDGDELVQNHFFDVGVAVSSDRGLVVPVLRDCDRRSFAEIEKGIAALADRVRTRTITLEELTGGCFTITNGGIFGSLLSTPILNPPQSGILGMHAIKKRAVVVNDAVVARPMMYLAMSYDHRVVDGRDAVTFLKRIVECLEHPERMLLEV